MAKFSNQIVPTSIFFITQKTSVMDSQILLIFAIHIPIYIGIFTTIGLQY